MPGVLARFALARGQRIRGGARFHGNGRAEEVRHEDVVKRAVPPLSSVVCRSRHQERRALQVQDVLEQASRTADLDSPEDLKKLEGEAIN